MSAQIEPISTLTQRATSTLIREFGVVDTIRFRNQFRSGSGDYTAQREQLFQGMSAKQILDEIKGQRNSGG